MTVNVVVIGAGGFGRETLDVIEAHNLSKNGVAFNVLGVIDDLPSSRDQLHLQSRGYKYLGNLMKLAEIKVPFLYFTGVGNPQVRARLSSYCDELGLSAGVVIHPTATIGSEVAIGAGTVICAGARVSTNVAFGKHVHLNAAAVVGHDSIIGDYASLNPQSIVSGNVTVGEQVLVGAGSVILQGIQVGSHSIVGASSCVTRDVEAGQIVLGVPAKLHGMSAMNYRSPGVR